MTLEVTLIKTTKDTVQAHEQAKEESLAQLDDLEAKLILYKEMYRQELKLIDSSRKMEELSSIVVDTIKEQVLDLYRITYLIDIKIGKLYTTKKVLKYKSIPEKKLTDGQGGCDRRWITTYTKEPYHQEEKIWIKESGLPVFDKELKKKVKRYKDLLDAFSDKDSITIDMVIQKQDTATQIVQRGIDLSQEMIEQIHDTREKIKEGLYKGAGPIVFYK